MSKSLLQRLEQFGEKPGLERIRFLLDALGRPQDEFPAVHVAGTNGKGSTAAMIASILRASGRRVGMFTSPHLVRYNERIVVDGQPISDGDLDALMRELDEHVQAAARDASVGQPTEFEVGTAAALTHFARVGVDIAVVEVGLGGRFDSTNVVHPVISVITPIGLDHTQRLGMTIAEIASDKAGIIRKDVPVVSAPQLPEAAAIIAAQAVTENAPLFVAGRDFEGKFVRTDKHGTTFDVRWKNEWFRALQVSLLGPYQAVNGATAVAACFALSETESDAHVASRTGTVGGGGTPGRAGAVDGGETPGRTPAGQKARQSGSGSALSVETVRAGLRETTWPGRMELMRGSPTMILDGSHNAEAAQALATTLRAVFPRQRPVFVVGILGEKPIDQMLHTLLPLGKAVVFTAPRSGRTPAADPMDLARRASGFIDTVAVAPAVDDAVARARALAGGDGIVCVCGSLYLVGEVRRLLAGE